MALHPAVAFGTVIAGAALFGAVGAVLALPAAAVIQAIGSTYIERHEVIETQMTAVPETRPGRRSSGSGGGGGAAANPEVPETHRRSPPLAVDAATPAGQPTQGTNPMANPVLTAERFRHPATQAARPHGGRLRRRTPVRGRRTVAGREAR